MWYISELNLHIFGHIYTHILGNFSHFRKTLDSKATTIFKNGALIFQWIALPRMQHGIHWSDSSNTLRMSPEIFRHVQQNENQLSPFDILLL